MTTMQVPLAAQIRENAPSVPNIQLGLLGPDGFAELERRGTDCEYGMVAAGVAHPGSASWLTDELFVGHIHAEGSWRHARVVLAQEAYAAAAWQEMDQHRYTAAPNNPAELAASDSVLGLVSDEAITWFTPNRMPVRDNSLARIILDTVHTSESRLEVWLEPELLPMLNDVMVTVTSDMRPTSSLLVGPVFISEHAVPSWFGDTIRFRDLGRGDLRVQTYWAAGLDEMQLATYQRLRDAGMDADAARDAVHLIAV